MAVNTASESRTAEAPAGPENTVAVNAPMQGTIVSIDMQVGEQVLAGQQLLVMEAMKMEHVIRASVSGIVRAIAIAPGDAILAGHPLVFIEEAEVAVTQSGRGSGFRPRLHPAGSCRGAGTSRDRAR